MIKLLICLLFTTGSYASSQNLLKCLGSEELKFHKAKIDSPLAKLNRELISSMIQFRDSIQIDSNQSSEICSAKHPSLMILKKVIAKKGKKLFKSKYNSKLSSREFAMDQMTLDQFESNSYKIFIGYIFSIQTKVESEKCLFNKVPGLKSFFYKMQYTLEEEGLRKIFNGLENPKLIFNILSDIESGEISCAQSKAAKSTKTEN